VKPRLESTAPLATPTLRSEAGPTLTAVRGTLALCAVGALWMAVPQGVPWWVAGAATLFLGGLSAGDLIRIGRHVIIGFEPVIRVDLNGDGQIGAPDIRIVKYRSGPTVPVLELPDGTRTTDTDLAWVIDRLPEQGRVPGWAAWKGQVLPSGLLLDDYQKLKPFLDLIADMGGITGRGPGAAGRVTMSRADIRRELL
jgi:hypothetical protein